MKNVLLVGLLGMALALGEAGAAEKLRIATVAPPGTSFHKHLEDLSAKWANAPGGGVDLTIYPGTQGGEPAIVRRMRVNQLQGAMLTAVGLSQIDESATALQLMPMTFRNWDEVDYVREKLEPELAAIFEKSGYVVLFWGDAGWVRFFSKEPLEEIGALKSRRVFTSSGTPKATSILREYYNPVVLEPDKILLGLRNGMIDTVPFPPYLANFTQVATEANHMLDLKWVPVVGALVVSKRTWDKLPAETRKYMAETAGETGAKIRADSRREDDEAIQAMVEKQNLKITKPSAAALAGWEAVVQKNYPDIRGDVVPAPMFDKVVASLREYRAR